MAIVQQKLVILISGYGFAQLLQSPLCCRMFGRVAMNQPSRSHIQRHKDIKHTKGGGHSGEEIASHDCLNVILQESGPALVLRSAWPGQLLAVLGDGAWRVPNLELQQQFIGDAFFSPGWIQPLSAVSSPSLRQLLVASRPLDFQRQKRR